MGQGAKGSDPFVPFLQVSCKVLRMSLHTLHQMTEARCLVVKHFVHTGGTFLQSLCLNEGCIKLFFREIDADKDFFRTFAGENKLI